VSSVADYAGEHATHVLVAPRERLASLARIYPRCVVIEDTIGRGVYPAINAGLASARDPGWSWATWLNDDDELCKGFEGHLERALAHDGCSDDAPWSYGGVRLLSVSDEDLGGMAVARNPSDIIPLAQSGINPLNQQGMLAPRAWVEAQGPLREDLRICADVDFWLRAAAQGARFRCSPEVVATFRLRAGQISGDVSRHRAEFMRVVESVVPVRRNAPRRLIANLRFRLGNAVVYAGRIRRSGFKGGFSLLEQSERKAY
jgi:GT2 family glycosyltransferase